MEKTDPIQILAIDDDEDARILYRNIFKSSDFNLITASDGLDGIVELLSNPFDVIILDLDMPNMNGVETLYAIKQRKPGIPILIISCNINNEVKDLFKSYQGIWYLEKPIRVTQLTAKIKELSTHSISE